MSDGEDHRSDYGPCTVISVEIRKYVFDVADFELDLPEHAPILSVQVQYGKPTMWVAVNPEKETVKRQFCVVSTGQPIAKWSFLRFIATFQLSNGDFVGHLFEDTTARA